jgi:tRNA threonylcarbamoyladenosine biosynthesis protein TsaB
MRFVLILAVDTSSPAGSLAVLNDTRTIGTVVAWTAELYSSRLFRQLDFLLDELSLSMDDFDLFTVAMGPGSFTGLRVGLTAVKGWAEVHGKPIAAVSTLEAVAIQSQSRAPRLLSVLDARRGQIYFAIYRRVSTSEDNGFALEGKEKVGATKDVLDWLDSGSVGGDLIIVTPVPELFGMASSRCETEQVAHRTVRLEEVSTTLAPYIGRLGFRRAREGQLTDSLKLDANYIRPSDAEVHWRVSTGS